MFSGIELDGIQRPVRPVDTVAANQPRPIIDMQTGTGNQGKAAAGG